MHLQNSPPTAIAEHTPDSDAAAEAYRMVRGAVGKSFVTYLYFFAAAALTPAAGKIRSPGAVPLQTCAARAHNDLMT